MKIGIVCYPSVGGSGILATELGHALALRGHEIHFFAYEVPFRLNLHQKNIEFHHVEISHYDLIKYPDYALSLAVKMAAIAEEKQLDIFHVHYAFPHATSAFLAKQLLKNKKIKVVTTLHGTDITFLGKNPAYFEIVKFSIEKSDAITAVSNSLKMQTYNHFQIKNPIEVIYNFFVPQLGLAENKPMRDQFVSKEQKLLIHSSNYRFVKRPMDLIEIFLHVRKNIDCRLLLIGSGIGLDDIRIFVAQKGLDKEVLFLGKSRNIDPYVASGDLFLLPSEQESFGLAALEAMAYGLPIIATDVGGIPELVENGKTGYLAAVGDTEKMGEYALELLRDERKYRAFSNAAKKRALEEFSQEKIVHQYETFYQKVLNSTLYKVELNN